jgi:hypothetical protein
VDLDLNHDKITDFKIDIGSRFPAAVLRAEVVQTNQVWGVQTGPRWMGGALKAGVRVGKNSAFRNYSYGLYLAIVTSGNSDGPWIGKKQAYLGLRFNIRGQVHYGWARLRVATQRNGFPMIKAVLTGYAYETIPNKPIITGKTRGPEDAGVEESNTDLTIPTPEPATLGLLAMGSPGLSVWRREESVGAMK